jgi:cation:H+ antiporter
MAIDLAIVFGGALLMLAISEVVIRLTLRLARHYRLSGSFVGLTILSVGTSLLEIMTHIVGSVHIVQQPEQMNTLSGLLLGSNIGSDVFQQNFVLPLVALLGTVVVVRRMLMLEVGALIAASSLLWFACLGGVVTHLEGALLVLAYAAYLYLLGRTRRTETPLLRERLARHQALVFVGLVILCFVGMALIADPVLGAATRLVAQLPMSASLFGIVVLGVCTAMPELMTALVSIYKGQREISAGILIGSNITNPLLSAGLGAMISGYTVPNAIVTYDLPVKILTGALIYVFLWRRQDLSRSEAVVLIALYFAYVAGRGVLFTADF